MVETTRATKDILDDMLSKDSQRIWKASCDIMSLSQNHDKIIELVSYREQMYDATVGIDLGGMLAPNSRFLKGAFEVIDFHSKGEKCPCVLLGENSNPRDYIKAGYFTKISITNLENSNYIDYYMIRCNRCNTKYKVTERMGHMFFWKWEPWQ